jgi:hypothetical protein
VNKYLNRDPLSLLVVALKVTDRYVYRSKVYRQLTSNAMRMQGNETTFDSVHKSFQWVSNMVRSFTVHTATVGHVPLD